jgi:hypothetical protein
MELYIRTGGINDRAYKARQRSSAHLSEIFVYDDWFEHKDARDLVCRIEIASERMDLRRMPFAMNVTASVAASFRRLAILRWRSANDELSARSP